MTRQERRERAEAMYQLYQAGMTNREIAARFHVSKTVIYGSFRAFGYPLSKGRGWHGDSEAHIPIARKGGETVAQNRDHMAEMGRKGGIARQKRRKAQSPVEGGEV